MRSFHTLCVATVIAACTAPHLNAQNPTIGFKVGPSFSTMQISDVDDARRLTRFTGGGFVRFDLGGFAIQPELMYVTKGASFREVEQGIALEGELRLDYIEVPVLFVLPFAAGAAIAPHVYAGPALALEVGCSFAVTAPGVNFSGDCDDADQAGGSDRRSYDVGAMIGGGVSLPMGPGAVLLEGRYNFGLLNLYTGEQASTVRNRSGAVLIGYSIPIGQR